VIAVLLPAAFHFSVSPTSSQGAEATDILDLSHGVSTFPIYDSLFVCLYSNVQVAIILLFSAISLPLSDNSRKILYTLAI
jgi:hypothetical protein